MAVTLHTGVRTATVGADWSVWDTRCRLVVTDPWSLHEARMILEDQLGAVDRIVGRRRRDSVGFPVTTLLDALLGRPARPDPTGIGPFPYGLAVAPAGVPVHRPAEPVVGTSGSGRTIQPVGRGGSVRAWAAQHCAEAVAEHTRCGALVSIGGDVATSGLAPVGGWRIEVGAGADGPPAVLVIDGGAISQLSTVRAVRSGGRTELSRPGRFVVPATGRTVRPVWRSVTVAASTATAASAACSDALLRGSAAAGWLGDLGVPAQLVDADGGAQVVGGWPVSAPRA